MNKERIDQLAFESGCNRHKYWDPKHPDLEGFIISQSVLDKFAELIVRGCADIANSIGEHGHYASAEMMEHFGVE